ncbi:LysR family transcriptional regulator [Stappia taiwanensis]|uniref:LysR family transcriptional regulator n=1 Tax=Stappia taiwanensis TaxID=992267 RepID=A0A838XTD5_9HYPH|nr:LysR family transcriptional regulator [Stappia taiwanensis]MBA4610324.1 LysR family transcriptional regulator [Stappia taiwanensis]GGE78691.1 LysR family transcriptional regulator [Stappia taiwanensis]
MAIKLEMLRCFAAVAQRGNLSEAADHLGRTPSAVSMMLKQFEEHLGAPLFETERKSKLTGLGQHIFEQALQTVNHFDGTVDEMLSYARSESGSVRIAAVPSVAASILPEVIKTFARARPRVFIDLRDMDSLAVTRELTRGRVDIGLASFANDSGELLVEPFLSDPFGLVCPPDHPLAERGAPVDWSDLQGLDFLANGTCFQITVPEFKPILDGSRMMVRNNTSLFSLVRAGVGVTLLPELTMRGVSDLRFLPLADENARRRVGILRAARAVPSPAVLAFLEELRDLRLKLQES